MFERDKDELRSLGVPIESVETKDGGPGLYQLKRESFYLPYLSLIDEDGWPASPSMFP
jgi:predicted DNA-binding transcriptional regulator YafY